MNYHSGHCWISGEPTHWILARNSDGSPQSVGDPLSGVVQVDLVLMSGHFITITVLEEQLPNLNLLDLQKQMIKAEMESFKSLPPGSDPTSHQQQLEILSSPPMGLL